VIAAVNGDAVGAGTNIAAACDFVYATESARFGEVFINVGLIPDCGGTFLIPELVGLRTAVELAMTGRIFNSSEAIEMGLITKAVPDGELGTAVNELLDDLAKKPTETLGLTKRAIYGNLGRQLDDALEREVMIQSQAAGTDSHAEGVAAALEDRPPSFE
jgi:enoyl-CoA hydratase/carnithine racemase